ncbi:SecC motif-containing protein [Arsukibacterium sp. MJ3]|uniref:YecA family protein n=1 Tax=Arsukibacterium sp. MJ3 TaxID=1632859 RepID=UPI0006270565|nr:SEC-C metal-binding domain-containing protein [Arsukibacterium sp. MJ3]KKO49090.1 SecC motif-containing protein [Arsukibacterium sp. MJ3]
MKAGRNDPCPCGSGKKYKQCCINATSKQHSDVFDDIAQTVAMNLNLTLEELNLAAQQRMAERNNRPSADFCGLTPTQMANWLYAPFSEVAGVKIRTPEDLSTSPVMRYLALIVDEAMQNDGYFKATSKGNLPAKLAKQASDLLPEFAVNQHRTNISISEFAGINEDKFNALHYSRILAEISGIIYLRSGRFHLKKAAQRQYQTQGIQAFFIPMLEAAITKYNWGYLDSFEHDVELRTFWLFMLWRLQSHGSVDQLIDDVAKAFPDLLHQLTPDEHFSSVRLLSLLIESRFIERFLQFWGFVVADPKKIFAKERIPRQASIQPLLTQTFHFTVNGH